MLGNWARLSGFAAILSAVLTVSFLWAVNYVPPQNVEWACEAKSGPNSNKPALNTFSCHTKQAESLNTQAVRTHQQANQDVPDSIRITDVFLAVFAGLLVIVTAALIAVGISQGRELRRTVKAAKQEFLATHRPKIPVKHLWLANDIFQIGVPITVNMTCVNVGVANATLSEIGIRCHVAGHERLLPSDPNMAATLFPRGVLEPGYNWPLPDLNIGRILAPHEQTDIQQKRANLYCVGWISYRDGAGLLRITGFCRVLRAPRGHAILTTANARFRICKHPDYEYED